MNKNNKNMNKTNQLLSQKKNSDKIFLWEPSKNDDSLGIKNIGNKEYNQNAPKNDNMEKNKIKTQNIFNRNINNNDNLNSVRNNIDERMKLVFYYLNIENILQVFISNNITFNDLLMLSREDLIDLGIPMLERNRIIHFIQSYIKESKNYSINEINSFFQKNTNLNLLSQSKKIKNDFENNNDNNINNKLKERDSQQEGDFCNIYPLGHMSHSRTNTSSKNNINTVSNKNNFFWKYKELSQQVDNYMNRFNEYKQNWGDSKRKYDNLMNSYLIRDKTNINKKLKKKEINNPSQNKKDKYKSKPKLDKKSLEKLKKLKERKEELRKKLEKVKEKSNHKKMIIKYLDEN